MKCGIRDIQDRVPSGSPERVAFKAPLAKFSDPFERAPRVAGLISLENFGAPSGVPFSDYLCIFCVVIASMVQKGGSLALSPQMATELVRIRSPKQYPSSTLTLVPDTLANTEKPKATQAAIWAASLFLQHNSYPAMKGSAFPPYIISWTTTGPHILGVTRYTSYLSQHTCAT